MSKLFLSCTCSVCVVKSHCLDTVLFSTVTDQNIDFLVPLFPSISWGFTDDTIKTDENVAGFCSF
jgi:hypothetical protein